MIFCLIFISFQKLRSFGNWCFQINKINIEGVIPLIHGGLSVLLGEYLYTRGERTSIQTLKPSLRAEQYGDTRADGEVVS